MYLRIILECEEEGLLPLSARIVERLGRRAPTVHKTIYRMQEHRLITIDERRHLLLTRTGRRQAVAVMRRHRLAELLLVDILGVPYEQAHPEADRLQHALSDHVEQVIFRKLGYPIRSPYGNPIPGLTAIGGPPAPRRRPRSEIALTSATPGGTFVVDRLGEWVQTLLLAELTAAGVVPGRVVTITHEPNAVIVSGVCVPEPLAHGIIVTADPDPDRR
ncbi:metal-dependent transcriptional regulator [Actinoplanes bogorensis]|uniref:Metal-dependent transcriptional regulator n=1 Tax=Paractinoplanes bogorensis TaxID=1610840 RepID=A0ABS5YWZ5_9ACTN|nr:metal-dependent transcriptional regulator [Actinoplanes bogorensis]MBU2667963.1 metal-dependent transcriptional regulator [Actinoplanes bogorensis]